MSIYHNIAGVNLPENKRLLVALTYVFGIGPKTSEFICAGAKIDPTRRVKDLTEQEMQIIRDIVGKNYMVEGDLRRKVKSDIQALMSIRCFRGVRHSLKKPCRGQRTHTNAKTVAGKAGKKTLAIANKKKV